MVDLPSGGVVKGSDHLNIFRDEMEDFKKIKQIGSNGSKIQDKKHILKSSANSHPNAFISNKNYSISGHRKKRVRHELLIKVTCANCQTVSSYQTGDYVKCSKCNSDKFTSRPDLEK